MSVDSVRFPTVLPRAGLRRRLVVAAGRVLRWVDPASAERAVRGELSGELGLRERLLVAAAVDDAERSGDLAALEPLHRWMWSGAQAEVFHQAARERFDRWWGPHHSAIVEPLREQLDAGRFTTLCEVGTGNGLVLAELARCLPGLERLIGVDLSAAQVQANARERHDPRVSFVAADGAAWLTENAGAGWAVFTNAGVLEYFPQGRLDALFRVLAARAPACVALVEPLAEGFDPARPGASVPYSAEKSFSHPYVAMLERAGFRVTWRAEQRFEGVRWLLLVAVAQRG